MQELVLGAYKGEKSETCLPGVMAWTKEIRINITMNLSGLAFTTVILMAWGLEEQSCFPGGHLIRG